VRNSSDGVSRRRPSNVNNRMQAKCPYCAGKVEVHFAEGNLWTRACQNPECAFENGGRIHKGDDEPPDSSGECVMCGGPTKWLLIGEMCNDEIEVTTTEQK